MRIIVITPSHNEKEIMPAYIAHYKRMGADIHIFDNHSTDGSDQLARELGCKVDYYGKPDTYETSETTPIQNETWRRYQGTHDIALMVDMDEFVFPIRPFSVDQPAIVRTNGFNATTLRIPTDGPIEEQPELWQGIPKDAHSKPCVLNLHKLVDVDFDAGIHKILSSTPRYRHLPPQPGAPLMFHFRHMGTDEWALRRYQERRDRVRRGTDLQRGHSAHYNKELDQWLELRRKSRENAKPIPKPQELRDALTPEQMAWPKERKWWAFW